MLLAMADGLKCTCSRVIALDLEAVSMMCTGIREGGRRGTMSKTPRISMDMDILASTLPFWKKWLKKLIILM